MKLLRLSAGDYLVVEDLQHQRPPSPVFGLGLDPKEGSRHARMNFQTITSMMRSGRTNSANSRPTDFDPQLAVGEKCSTHCASWRLPAACLEIVASMEETSVAGAPGTVQRRTGARRSRQRSCSCREAAATLHVVRPYQSWRGRWTRESLRECPPLPAPAHHTAPTHHPIHTVPSEVL